MLDNIDIQYKDYVHYVHMVFYPGFFPATKKSYKAIKELLSHLDPDQAAQKAALIALHIEDLEREAMLPENAENAGKQAQILKQIERQRRYFAEMLQRYLYNEWRI